MSGDAPLSALVQFVPHAVDRDAGGRARSAVGGASAPEFVAGVAGCSAHLSRLIEKDPERTRLALNSTPAQNLERAIDSALRAAGEPDLAAQMKALRLAKADAALSSAFAEISGARTTMEAADDLSRFADAAVQSGVRMALRQQRESGFRPADGDRPERDSGFVVIAMGKHGAFELNYSSDIDLVVLFDGASKALGGSEKSRRLAVAAARGVISRLGDQTADGYVFRTDLRLRPDPGVSAAAVSVNAAETYYESYGQNWERAAFIKARAAAGDISLGDEFIRRLRPFVWRKSLDFAAIEEIYSVMRQTHASARESEFFGRDLKRGRGGIREIEFFAQTQQLIGGGKNPALRRRATLDALTALAEAGAVSRSDAQSLSERYRYLRKVEHRLQMIGDEQTHRIPSDEEGAARLAAFLGEQSLLAFKERMIETFRSIEDLTSGLFQTEARRSGKAAPLVFTGVENDPQTIATLRALGFQRPEQVADAFRRWQAGEARATRSPRSRALLAKAAPQIIHSLAAAGSPDAAFAAFDAFLRALPAGVQIFALFLNRPDVFERLIRIMAVSPFLAREAARRPYLAEALIESRWPDPAPARAELDERLAVRLAAVDGYEATLNAARRWAQEESFAASAQLVAELIAPEDAAERFTRIADSALNALLALATRETSRLYGAVGGAVAVVALGRLGARKMTAASDVDLLFIYDAPDGGRASGEGRLDAVTYYGRLVRRFLSAVTTPTEEGVLYEADMQLRPSGGKGPAAVSLSAFRRYYEEAAWTWEVMALTKARVLAGDERLGAIVTDEIAAIIRRPRQAAFVARDVDAMRERLKQAKPAAGPWDLKNAVGGLVEVDFALQHLLLVHAAAMDDAQCRDGLDALEARAAISRKDASVLREASRLFEAVHQMSRVATGGVFAPGAAGEAATQIMARIFEARDMSEAEERLVALQAAVRGVYERIVRAAAKEAS